MKKIGIIGAMNEEIIELREDMVLENTSTIGSFTYYEGKIKDRDVVLVESGIGKVNSSVCATILINSFNIDCLLFTGVAGAVNNELNIGDIVVSDILVEHDFDCTAFGMKPGVIPRMENSNFKSDNNLIEIAKEAATEVLGEEAVKVGTIVSGDQFIASKDKIEWLGSEFNAMCTEMEGASVAHVCQLFDIPFVVIRAISDKADGSAHMDFKEFVIKAAANSKKVIDLILSKI